LKIFNPYNMFKRLDVFSICVFASLYALCLKQERLKSLCWFWRLRV
jgi:hypothetical protein